MDVSVNSEVKGIGVATTVVPAVEREDRVKPQVAPVAGGTESTRSALGEKELHRRSREEEKKQGAVNAEELKKAVEEIQNRLDAMGTRLNFTLSKEPEAVVVKVTDRQSGELVKQFPSEEVLKLRKKLQELSGLLFDEQA
ncbi:flagellar protein FlaG [Thiovibrio sp. JS02]